MCVGNEIGSALSVKSMRTYFTGAIQMHNSGKVERDGLDASRITNCSIFPGGWRGYSCWPIPYRLYCGTHKHGLKTESNICQSEWHSFESGLIAIQGSAFKGGERCALFKNEVRRETETV